MKYKIMDSVRPKKKLGQHFLKDLNIARKIVDSLGAEPSAVLEVGPGMGVLTRFLLQRGNLMFMPWKSTRNRWSICKSIFRS